MSESPMQEAWRTYQQELIGRHVPAGQQDECRRAFYAGAFALFRLALEASTDPKSEAESAAVWEQLAQELQEYARINQPPPAF